MQNFSPFSHLAAFCCATSLLLFSSCKKEPVVLSENKPVVTYADISGTSWEYIASDFVDNRQLTSLVTFQNKLVVSYMQPTEDGIITSGHLDNDHIVPHYFGYSMSGIGFDKLVVTDNELYALGSLDSYGSFKMNPNYLTSMGGLAWDTYWNSDARQYGIAKIGDEIVGCFSQPPYVRSKGNTVFPDVERNLSTPAVFEVIEYNGELVCAGLFDAYDGATLNNIARWDGSAWVPLGAGLNGQVTDLAVFNGELIASGAFTKTGDNTVNCRFIAKWNGNSWTAMGDEITGGYAGIRTLYVFGDQLFAGGDFTGTASVFSPNIIKWKAGSWHGLAEGAPLPVDAITVFKGHLYIANANYTPVNNFFLRLE